MGNDRGPGLTSILGATVLLVVGAIMGQASCQVLVAMLTPPQDPVREVRSYLSGDKQVRAILQVQGKGEPAESDGWIISLERFNGADRKELLIATGCQKPSGEPGMELKWLSNRRLQVLYKRAEIESFKNRWWSEEGLVVVVIELHDERGQLAWDDP